MPALMLFCMGLLPGLKRRSTAVQRFGARRGWITGRLFQVRIRPHLPPSLFQLPEMGVCLLQLPLAAFPAGNCALCRQGLPLAKPGSRALQP